MPGINIVATNGDLSRQTVMNGYSDTCQQEGDKIEEYFADENAAISCSMYRGYPILTDAEKFFFIVCEGLIYNKTDDIIKHQLAGIAQNYVENKDFKKAIIDFIESSDGDYLIAIHFITLKEIIIFNDRWARLPCFYSAQENVFAFSRSLKFILNIIPKIRFNNVAMSEFLIFGYNLGQKTLVRDVQRMNPASLLRTKWSTQCLEVSCDELAPTDLTTIDSGLTRDECVIKSAQLFRESLETRVRKTKEIKLDIVIDLSGGYDTRAVFVGLCNLGADFVCHTDRLVTGDESDVAKRLAELYSRKLLIFEADRNSDDIPIMRKLTYLTDCVANCWTTYHCYQDTQKRGAAMRSSVARYMGFGGEFIRHPFRPKSQYRNLEEMLLNNAYTNFVQLRDACHITNLNERKFEENIRSEVARFPENTIQDKIKHLYFEYYNKLVNGGEDRHRLFCWTVQPLWAKSLFYFENHEIQPKWINYGFFIDFLRALDPKSLRIPIYGSKVNLNSSVSLKLFSLKVNLKNLIRDNRYFFGLKAWLFTEMERFKRSDSTKMRIEQELVNACQSCKLVSSCLDVSAIKAFCNSRPKSISLYQLLTLVLYIEEIETKFRNKI